MFGWCDYNSVLRNDAPVGDLSGLLGIRPAKVAEVGGHLPEDGNRLGMKGEPFTQVVPKWRPPNTWKNQQRGPRTAKELEHRCRVRFSS